MGFPIPSERRGEGQRLLHFELGGAGYALRAADVSGVGEAAALRAVPGAPAAVLGLTEWRGTLLTVLDLARLLERPGPPPPGCLARLAGPLDKTALLLPEQIRLVRAEPGHGLTVLDPARLIRRIELEPREAR